MCNCNRRWATVAFMLAILSAGCGRESGNPDNVGADAGGDWADADTVELYSYLRDLNNAELSQNEFQLKDARDALANAVEKANAKGKRKGRMTPMVLRVADGRVVLMTAGHVEEEQSGMDNIFVFGEAQTPLEAAAQSNLRAMSLAPLAQMPKVGFFAEGVDWDTQCPIEHFVVCEVGKACDASVAKDLAFGDIVNCEFDVLQSELLFDGKGLGIRIANPRITKKLGSVLE